jgi:hypothetical protein
MCASKGSVQYPISDAAQMLLYQRAINDNLYKGEFPQPKPAREPTVEDFKKRMERKLDLSDDRGDDHGERTQEGSNGGRKWRDGTGGSDAG